jgi:hypothetical protein
MAGSVEREYKIITVVKSNLWWDEIKNIVEDEVASVLEDQGIELKTVYVEEN